MAAILQTPGLPSQADFHEAISSRGDRWYAACLKITRNRALAEDAVQDALLSAWHKRHQFDHSARLDTWIHRIAVNAALQLLRKQRPRAFEPLQNDIRDESDDPVAALAGQDLGKTLSSAMTRLSDFERVCFVLKHLEQWRLREIADELGSDIGAVKQGLFRALRKLRQLMAGLQDELL